MPKKKPITKRINKLFDDITEEKPSAKSKARAPKSAPVEKPVEKQKPTSTSAVTNTETTARRARAVETPKAVMQSNNALALAFQTSPTDWSTLQVIDEFNERKWTEDDQLLVQQVTDQLSLALENARLFQVTQSRAEELSVLNEMGNDLSAQIEIKGITDVIYKYTSKLMDTKNFFIAIYDEDKNEKTFPIVYKDGKPFQLQPSAVDEVGFTDYIIHNKRTVFAPANVPARLKELGIDTTTLGGQTAPVLSLLGTPMIFNEVVLGVIVVESIEKTNQFDEHDREILTTIASQAAIAIENGRLFQESQRRAQEMSVLAEVGREISATLELRVVLEKIAEYAIVLLNSVTSAVYIPDENFTTLIPIAVIGEEAEEIKKDYLQIGTGILGNIALSKTGEIANNIYQNPRAVTITGTAGNVPDEHLMGVPIMLQGRITGIMATWRVGKGTEYDEAEFTFLSNLAQQAAIAIENARLFQDVTSSQSQLSEALRIARIGYFEIDWIVYTITFTDELFSLLNTNAINEGGYTFALDVALQKFVIPEDIKVATKAVQDALSSESERSEVSSEVRYKTSDGRIIWVSSTYQVERNAEGKPVKIAGSSQDITERKSNELTQAAITQISESALTSRNAEELFQTVHESIRALLPANNFYIAMYDKNTNMLSFPYYVDEQDTDWGPRKLGRGLTSYVIRSGKSLRITPEIYSDMEASGEVLSDGAPSVDWLGVPLRSEGVTLGVMAVQTYDLSTRITDEQAENLVVIASQTAGALERLQARESLQRRNTYLAASSEIGRLVTSTLDINTIFTRTVNLINDRLGFYFAAIYQVEEEGYHAILREGTGSAGETMKSQMHRVSVGSQTLIGKATASGETLFSNDVQSESLYQPNPFLLDTKSEVVIPLKVGGKILGAIDIHSVLAQAFAADDLSVLQSLADQVAVSINNANLYEESQELIKNLKEVDQLKSQFLANMSHELRTPLNSIIGFSRVILKGIDGPVTDMQNQDLTAIYNSGQHLLSLINDILDLARIEAGKMELNFEEVHLSEMIHSVFSTAKGLVKEKTIQLVEKVPEGMPTVRGDTMRVRQVLLNLISNASKFTDEGSITVETQVQKGPNDKLEALIKVVDTGPGITPEGQEKLFKAFSQVDGSATRKSGGSGLGLSICANLVQLHNGKIGVYSDEGKGSTFWFTLPLFAQPVDEIPTDKKVVLAIDDDPQVISLYERYLTPQGYYVVPLTEPAKAKEKILELKPYAVTLDIMMPNIDGWTVLTEIKSDPATRDIPIIICSIVEQTDKGFNLGASDYLVKPILEDDLAHALDRLNKDGKIQEVLVIDDDPNDLRLIEKILGETNKYTTTLAEGGRKGWDLINEKKPDAIILDIFMPDMDGFMILEKLRESPQLREIPVLVVSGGGLTNEQQKQLADYGQRLIAKGSLKEDDLINSIEQALKRIGD